MKKPKTKPSLKDEAEAANGKATLIRREMLLEICPPKLRPALKAAKTLQQMADLIYVWNHGELTRLRKEFQTMDTLVTKLEQFFLQELPKNQTGVSGKLGRCERTLRTVPQVEDWNKLYAHVSKNKEFDLLQRRLNDKAIAERWEHNKQVPGVKAFEVSKISVTAVKGRR